MNGTDSTKAAEGPVTQSSFVLHSLLFKELILNNKHN